MTSLQPKTYLASFTAAVVTVAALVYGAVFLIPGLQAIRTKIDNDRAAEAVIVQQQSNLKLLSQNLEEIKDRQGKLDAETWSFTTEDAFFTWFDGLVSANHLAADEMTLADAVPGTALVNRSLSATLTGSGANLLAAVSAIQQHQPLVAINAITMTPAESQLVSIHLQAVTLWR
ncbi:MAG: hypothetical protein HY975_00345 [Candidatus Kerfeldbacteria bacterium]|nr:hypothetical protein [Candidatus Kerfeldbacteria bacterium]